MAGTDPIRLGSATLSGLMFESGSSITTSDSGIQSCEVRALYSDGSTVFNVIPSAGVGFNAVFGNSYLPSTFLVDYTGGGPGIEYLEGKIARVTISFKRQDPAQIGIRKIYVDSILQYSSPLVQDQLLVVSAGGSSTSTGVFSSIGFPEPTVTVKRSSTTRPGIGSGGLTQIYALPGSTNAQGFPDVPPILVTYASIVPAGATVLYYDGTNIVAVGPLTHQSTFNFVIEYRPNILGWQLTRLKSDPLSASNFYDIEEEWRNYYFFYAVSSVTIIPPP